MKKILVTILSVISIQNLVAMERASTSAAATTAPTEQAQAIFQAIEHDDLRRLTELISVEGCNVNCRGIHGRTPLQAAIMRRNIEMVQLLLKKNAVGNLGDDDGNSALHTAIQSRNFDIVLMLLEENIEVNIQNNLGETAFYMAVSMGELTLAQCVLNAGASITLLARNNKSARELARERGDHEMLRAIDAIAQANEEAGDTEIMRFIEEDNARWEAAQADRGAQAEIRRLRRDTEVLQARERATETADQLERARTERRQHDTAQDFRHEVKTTIAHGAFTIGRRDFK